MSEETATSLAVPGCRACGAETLKPVIDLGLQALTGLFPSSPEELVPQAPLELVRCGGECGLIQLRHSCDASTMYGANYGYRSSLNRSMVRHLTHRIQALQEHVVLESGDLVLDIGSNDGTLLRAYPGIGLKKIGIDPTAARFREYYEEDVEVVPAFFSAAAVQAVSGGDRAKVVTSIAMFYDLDDPLEFMRQVHEVLDPQGVWVFEQSYLPLMLSQTAYDTICHEHLTYYGLRQIKWLTDRAGLKIVDIEFNAVNGGSFCLTVAKQDSAHPECTALIEETLERETASTSDAAVAEFCERVVQHRDVLREFFAARHAEGDVILGYGASTKGNVILQFCGLSKQDLPSIAEVNESKFGCFTPRTRIPIESEADAKARKPGYLFVLPWHFRESVVEREAEFLAGGGKLVFPLPSLEVVGGSSA
jgi:NDP-4-keto-2,6-dideoxyhexose 3-C-methyltransferase